MIKILIICWLFTVLLAYVIYKLVKPRIKKTAHRLYPPYVVGMHYRNRIIEKRLKIRA